MNGKKQRKRIVTMLLVVAFVLNVGVAPRESKAKEIIKIDKVKELGLYTWMDMTNNKEYKLTEITEMPPIGYDNSYWINDKNGNPIKPKRNYIGKYNVYMPSKYKIYAKCRFGQKPEIIYTEEGADSLHTIWQKKSIYIVKEGDFISYAGTDRETFDKMKLIAKQKKAKKSVPKSKRINKGLVCTYDEPNEYGVLFPKDHKGKTIKLQAGYKAKMKINGKSKAKWKSSKKNVATINKKGIVTANHKGTTTITGKVGKKTYKCKIKVRPVDIDYVYTGVPELNDNLKSSPSNPIVVKNGTVLNIGFKKGTVLGVFKGLYDKTINDNAVRAKYIDQNKREYYLNMTCSETKPHQRSKKLKKQIYQLEQKYGQDIYDINSNLYSNYHYGMIPREKMSDTIGIIRFDNAEWKNPQESKYGYDGGVRAVIFKACWALSATHLRTKEFTIYVRWEK